MITSFVVIFFFFNDIFFLPKATKKNTHPKKKYSPTSEVTHPTKHVYTYDMPFLCPPTVFKIFHLLYTERIFLSVIFFFEKYF